jgi:flagellar FliJ protein
MAKKFIYRFDSILRLREYNTQLARESLNFAVKIKNDKLDLIEDHNNTINNNSKIGEVRLTAFELQTTHHNINFIREEIKKIGDEIKELDEIIGVRRSKLTEAMKDEKIMEKLKEKKLNDYLYELNKEETAVFDEIAGRRAQYGEQN